MDATLHQIMTELVVSHQTIDALREENARLQQALQILEKERHALPAAVD